MYRNAKRGMAFVLLGVLAACDHGGTVDADRARTRAAPVAPASAVLSASGAGPVRAAKAASTEGTATFNYPSGITTDSAGNIFVADTGNDTIRKITPEGMVTTIAGAAGVEGHADGSVAAAQFNQPAGVAVDSADNIFVADTGNNTIRKITPGGVVTTVAGTAGVGGNADGSGAAAQFNQPSGVAVDAAGNIFVADTGNNIIRKITPGGVVTTIAGTAGKVGLQDGSGAAARFDQPVGIATDRAGNVYVCDSDADSPPRKITPAGKVTTIKAMDQEMLANKDTGMDPDPGGDTLERYARMVGTVFGIAFDKQGNAFVVNDDGDVRKITPQGDMKKIAQVPAHPRGIAIDNAGKIYVSIRNENTIHVTAETGAMTSRIFAGITGKAGHADGLNTAR